MTKPGTTAESALGGEIEQIQSRHDAICAALRTVNNAALLLIADMQLDPRLLDDRTRRDLETLLEGYMTLLDRAGKTAASIGNVLGFEVDGIEETHEKKTPDFARNTTSPVLAIGSVALSKDTPNPPSIIPLIAKLDQDDLSAPQSPLKTEEDIASTSDIVPSILNEDIRSESTREKFNYWKKLIAPTDIPEEMPSDALTLVITHSAVATAGRSYNLRGKHEIMAMNSLLRHALSREHGYFARADLRIILEMAPDEIPTNFGTSIRLLGTVFKRVTGVDLYVTTGNNASLRYRLNPRLVPVTAELLKEIKQIQQSALEVQTPPETGPKVLAGHSN